MHGIVVHNQLADQLPGGKCYQPSEEIREETALCKKTNILSERDFAQMDRKFHQKPNMTTIAASGVIMYLNNKTGSWLEGMSEAEQEKAVEIAMKGTSNRITMYKEKRKGILQSRMDAQERKKLATQVKQQQKEAQKEKLCAEIEKIGGLWKSEDQMRNQLKDQPKKKQLCALKLQLDFRKVVLDQRVPDKKLLQMGTTVDKKRRPFTVSELQDNLAKIMMFSAQTPEARADEIMEVIVRPEQERRDILNQAKEVLKEKTATDTAEHSSLEPRAKKPKKKVAKLFGKRIKHKWEIDGDEIWYDGTACCAAYDDDQYDTLRESMMISMMCLRLNCWRITGRIG